MMCFGGIGLAALIALRRRRRQRHVCENAEGQILGLHRSTAIYISATILLFLLEYSLLITSYNTELACHISINSRSSLNHFATPPLLLIAKVTVAERIIKTTRCDWLVATTNVFARTLATKVWPIQFSNRPDVCCVGLDNKRQKF